MGRPIAKPQRHGEAIARAMKPERATAGHRRPQRASGSLSIAADDYIDSFNAVRRQVRARLKVLQSKAA